MYWGYVAWDFTPDRSYQGEQTRYRQLMTEPGPTLAGYGEVLVLQQDGCGLCSRWILSLRSMVYTTRCRADKLLTSQRLRSTSSVSELLQPSVALASIVGTSYRKTKDLSMIMILIMTLVWYLRHSFKKWPFEPLMDCEKTIKMLNTQLRDHNL